MTELETETIYTVDKAIDVYWQKGRFHECIDDLAAEGFAPMTVRELAEARLWSSAKSRVRRNAWVAEGVAYLPNHDMLVVSREYNPLLRKNATKRYGPLTDDEFHITPDVTEQLQERAETDPDKAIKSGVLRLHRYFKREFPPTAFQDHSVTRFLFQEYTAQYGQFLRQHKMANCLLYFNNHFSGLVLPKQKQAYIRAGLFHEFSRSVFGASDVYDYNNTAFGARTTKR